MHAAFPWWRRALVSLSCAAVLLTLVPAPARADAPDSDPATSPTWSRPVAGRVVRPFEAPANPFAAGHRGADLAAPPGTPVRAAGGGTVVFAGDVAGSLHVVVAHTDGLRTSYSFLLDVTVRAGQSVGRGDVIGHAGGSGDDHEPGVLHFGLRVGDRYVDPMALFRPRDLTELVRLVPAVPRPARPWVSPARERADLELGLAFGARRITPPAAPGAGAGPVVEEKSGDDDGGCGDGIPVIGDAVSAGCDAVDWAADTTVAALDEGLSILRDAGRVGLALAAKLEGPLRSLVRTVASAANATRNLLLQTPVGRVLSDLVEVGRRLWAWTQRVCSKDSPPADGSGGDGHLLMAVGGIDSHTFSDGTTFALDTHALGYPAADVTWFSYASAGGDYSKDDTHGDLREKAKLLGRQLAAMARAHPGQPVDLIAHSQGGVVVDWFLTHIYKDEPGLYPPLETVVTLSSPHQGAPLATAGSQLRASRFGRAVEKVADTQPFFDHPPSDATAVKQLAEGSHFMTHLFDGALPAKIHITSIGGTDDAVVPPNHISAPGADELVVDVGGINDHHKILTDPRSLMAVRAALDHKPLPCTSLVEGFRSAIEPVVVSRVEHDLGDLGDVAKLIEKGIPAQ